MKRFFLQIFFCSLIGVFFLFSVAAQEFKRDFPINAGGLIEIKNSYGRISVQTEKEDTNKASIYIVSTRSFSENDLRIKSSGGKLKITVLPQKTKTRIDFTVKLPARRKVLLETNGGEIAVIGDFIEARAKTETGTIYADVSLDNLKYKFVWTASRPRFLSEIDLAEVKEKSAGRFQVKGTLKKEVASLDSKNLNTKQRKDSKTKEKKKNSDLISLNFSTARGIVLLNVRPNQVPSNLQIRPLTEAAKAIIRSGDSFLVNAIRRASPKYFGDYAATLPPRMRTPVLSKGAKRNDGVISKVKRVTVQVTDINNRSIAGLDLKDFVLSERGNERDILSVKKTTAPFNLVLLLDVSGSVEHYVDFIRKAARNFIRTTGSQDRIAIVIFNEDVKTLSNLTLDRNALSESLDTFDAGGGTAYYDSLAYSLTETLRPLKGDRTAIVVLSDGDDNRSFLPFSSLLGSIQESGALIYPLYVPSGLIAASATNDPNKSSDPLRSRFLGLTSKAQSEGEILAKVSGGVYYPISRLSDLQKAYDDIVLQLRTAYTITYRSNLTDVREDRTSPRLKVKVKRENSFVKIGPISAVKDGKVSQKLIKKYLPQSIQEYKPGLRSRSFFSKIGFKPTNPVRKTFSTSFQSASSEITGEIDKIIYTQFVADKLRTFNLDTLNINKTPGAFLLLGEKEKIAVSRWISPKRTRSYPYERVYDTLAHKGKKVAVIPVVKDEGLGGDRDFIQWDTISLLSLLDVHVVLAYYDDAIKNVRRADKITKQKFENDFVRKRLEEVFNFNGSSREWNEKEAKNLKAVFEKAKFAYRKISKKTATYLHNEDRLNERIKFAETPQRFIGYSRRRSRNAQAREFVTIQPNEALSTLSKAKVTITNALYGKFYFTVDETLLEPKSISLIEAKHSRRSKMPSKNDIKDGLIKMMLYTNLKNVKFGERRLKHKTMIRLTSSKLIGSINSNSSQGIVKSFVVRNSLGVRQAEFLIKIFQEARANNFIITLEKGVTGKR